MLSPLGLESVVAAESRLSCVDGEAGTLIVAGQPIGALAGVVPWSQVAARLLALGTDTSIDVESFSAALGAARVAAWHKLPRALDALDDPDGMAAVRAALPLTLNNDRADSILGALCVLTGAWLRRQEGRPPIAPRADASVAADLLHMCVGSVDAQQIAALDTYLSTVIDHGLNASTFTARVVASTGADPLSSVVAAMGALKGPLHGGAPGPVLDMLDAVGSPDNALPWLVNELNAGRRIMGMGHRVYRVRDPRAAVLEHACAHLDASAGRLPLARAIESAATSLLAERYPQRPMRANVEFGTAILLDAIGLHRRSFTLLFACSRAAGWLAHAAEQQRTGRLMRPRLRYTGARPLINENTDAFDVLTG